MTARGWSDESIGAARICAQEIARRVAQRLMARPGDAPRYPYGDRPLPEPILSEFRDGASLFGVITRNGYGSVVMNTDQMMFVDIDRQDTTSVPRADLQSLFSGLFGKPAPSAAKPVDTVTEGIRKVLERWRLSARVYRTAGGYRVLIVNRRFTATSPEAEALMREFGADPLYVRLCRMQESFRARLTPKPWRLGFRQPPVEYPFETPVHQARFNEWEREYESKTAGHATCAYQNSFGTDQVLPEFDPLIRFHDETSKAASSLPLA